MKSPNRQDLSIAYDKITALFSPEDQRKIGLRPLSRNTSNNDYLRILNEGYKKIVHLVKNKQQELDELKEDVFENKEHQHWRENAYFRTLNENWNTLEERAHRLEKISESLANNHQEENIHSKSIQKITEDNQKLIDRIEREEKINEELNELWDDIRVFKSAKSEMNSLIEENEKLRRRLLQLQFDSKELKKLNKNTSRYQEEALGAMRNLNDGFKALNSSNKHNFEIYNELLLVKDSLDEELELINMEMDEIRMENTILQSETINIENLKLGLNEQESLNRQLSSKLDALNSKLSPPISHSSSLNQTFEADLNNNDYQLDGSFVLNLEIPTSPSQAGGKKGETFTFRKQRINKLEENSHIISELRSKAEELSQHLEFDNITNLRSLV